LSEFESDGGAGATLINGAALQLGSGNVQAPGPWQPSHVQDVAMELLLPDGSLAAVDVVYTGNGGAPWQRSDFNRDGAITVTDWQIFRTGLDQNLSQETLLSAYLRGDLDGDLDNDVDDFSLFKADFIAANSAAAFTAMIGMVPEPTTGVLAAVTLAMVTFHRKLRSQRKRMRGNLIQVLPSALIVLVATCSWCCCQSAEAGFQLVAHYNLGEDDPGAAAGNIGNDPTTAAVGPDLVRLGAPTYSADVPAGVSTLSMSFPGNGGPANGADAFYYTTAPATDIAQNIRYSFDAKALGAGSDGGFSFLASLGSNFGGISVVEIGGQVSIFFPGAGGGTGSAPLPIDNAWHNYQVDWDATLQEATLRLDGNVISTRSGAPANNQIVDALTIGGNFRENESATAALRTLSSFEGGFNGLIDNFQMWTFVQPLLTLEVNTTNGTTRLINDSGEPIEFDFYTIGSAAEALNPGGSPADANGNGRVDGEDLLILQRTNLGLIPLWEEEFGTAGAGGPGWTSLQDQNLPGFPAGNGSGNGWEQSGGSGTSVLTEAYLSGSSVLGDGQSVSLGAAYNPSILGPGVDGDLTFRFRSPSGASFDGNVVYVSGGIATSIPEPSAALLALCSLACAAGARRAPKNQSRCAHLLQEGRGAVRPIALLIGWGLVLCMVTSASAAYTVDRLYQLGEGDNDAGTPTAGAVVGSTTSTGGYLRRQRHLRQLHPYRSETVWGTDLCERFDSTARIRFHARNLF
jgi:hypothetical protein